MSELKRIISQITLETSNSRKDCLTMTLMELMDYYDSLVEESDRRNEEYKKAMKKKE